MTQFEKAFHAFLLHRDRFHQLANTHLVDPDNEFRQRWLDKSRCDAYSAMNHAARYLENNFPDELAAFKSTNKGWPYSNLPGPDLRSVPAPKSPAPIPTQKHFGPIYTWAGVPDYSIHIKDNT